MTEDAPAVGSTARAGDRRPPVGILMALGIIGPLTIHLILPSLPQLQRVFSTDYATIQLLISFYVVAFGVAQLFIGPLADMVGRRNVLIAGLSLYALSSALCALAPRFEFLLGFRILQAVGACTGIVLARAIIRDHVDERQSTKYLGYLSMGVAIGPMVAPLAGGILFETTGWRGLFWVLAAAGTAGLALAWLFVGESGTRRTGAGRFRRLFVEIGELLRNRRFLLYALNICFHTGMFYAFVVGGPYLASEFLEMTPKAYGAWFGTAAIGYASGNFLAGRLIGLFRGEHVVLAGAITTFIFNLVLLAVLAFGLHSPFAIFGAVAISTFSSGLLMPNSYSGALSADPALAGSASGFVGFLQFSFAAIFSTMAGFAIEVLDHPVALGLVMTFAVGAGLLTSVATVVTRPA